MNVKAVWGYVFESLLSQYDLYLYKNKNKRWKQMIYTKREIQTLATNCLLSTFVLYIFPPNKKRSVNFYCKSKIALVHRHQVKLWLGRGHICIFRSRQISYIHYIQERNCTKEKKKDDRYNFFFFYFLLWILSSSPNQQSTWGRLEHDELCVCSISIYNYK